jgi:ubiquinone/menaquinone biosynthesis C-methylase UbiE
MSQISNQNYLLHDQYKDSSNFSARVELHRRFSTNKYGWHRWVFDHIKAAPDSNVLELGCGPGLLWRANRDRIPDDWHITLSDFSPGMLQEARAASQ